MSKYEILVIVDPKADAKVGFDLVEEVFGKTNITKSEKLELTDLAYEIKGSNKAQYLSFELNAESHLIAEFTRRANINKQIWRQLVINLTSEKGYGKERKVFKKPLPFRKENSQNSENKDEKKEYKKPRVVKTVKTEE